MGDIFELSDEATDRVASLDPTLATYHGIGGHEHRWPDLSPAGVEASRALHAELCERARVCDTPDDGHRLAQRVLIEYCEGILRHIESGGHQVDLNSLASMHQTLRFIYGSMADQSAADWEAIIARVGTVGEPLAGLQATLDEGRRAGNVVSRRQVEAVIEQGASAAGDQSSFDSLRQRLSASPASSDKLARDLDAAIAVAKAAFASFNAYLETTYLPDAAISDAVGEDRYIEAAEVFLGTRLDLHSTYRWGWDEVERLWTAMQHACAEIDPAAPARDVLTELNTKPEYAANDLEHFISLMQERQQHALDALADVHFDVPEQIRRIDVQVEPAGGALAAHYVGPSEDFSRPGSVWYPVEDQEHFPLFSEISTAYHEGFPGHHLQVGVQLSLGDQLSRFHRTIVWYPGSGEGWALYAEHLMGELGFLERPEYVVGLLSMQLARAARVAIDIGVHLELPIPDDVSFHPGEEWTFDIAHELMTDRAFLPNEMATSEILRYFGWPGQAISYKVGERAILELRDEWRAAGHTDLKRFHSIVLGAGSVGLDLLGDHVRASF